MTRCPGWDASILPFRLATVRDRLAPFSLRLGSGPLPEAAMASFPLRIGLAITLALGLFATAPLDALARGSGWSSGLSTQLYSSGHAYRRPAASSRGAIKCLTCEGLRSVRACSGRSPHVGLQRP
jgi:hypothetical protein